MKFFVAYRAMFNDGPYAGWCVVEFPALRDEKDIHAFRKHITEVEFPDEEEPPAIIPTCIQPMPIGGSE